MPVLGVQAGLFLSLLAFVGCHPTTAREEARQRIHPDILATLDSEFSQFPNPDRTFVLCVKRGKEKPGIQPASFFVYATADSTVVYEREVENATVRWLDGARLSIVHIPGNVNGGENAAASTEIVDLGTTGKSK